jgi:hypothetical protein
VVRSERATGGDDSTRAWCEDKNKTAGPKADRSQRSRCDRLLERHAAAQKKTPALKMSVSFEIDENSAATNVSASGGAFGSLSSCVQGAVGHITTQQAPDVGTAQVAATFQFTPL